MAWCAKPTQELEHQEVRGSMACEFPDANLQDGRGASRPQGASLIPQNLQPNAGARCFVKPDASQGTLPSPVLVGNA